VTALSARNSARAARSRSSASAGNRRSRTFVRAEWHGSSRRWRSKCVTGVYSRAGSGSQYVEAWPTVISSYRDLAGGSLAPRTGSRKSRPVLQPAGGVDGADV